MDDFVETLREVRETRESILEDSEGEGSTFLVPCALPRCQMPL